MPARILGIVSIKGGVGKTTSTVNVGTALSEMNKKVLLVDADFGSPNLALHFGMVNPSKTLNHVFQGKVAPHEAIQRYNDNLDVMPCSVITQKIHPALLKEKLQPLRKLYDYILIDASPTLNETMLSTIMASDELLVVTSPDYPTLNATLYAVRVARKQKTPIGGLLVNRIHGKKSRRQLASLLLARFLMMLMCLRVLLKLSLQCNSSRVHPRRVRIDKL